MIRLTALPQSALLLAAVLSLAAPVRAAAAQLLPEARLAQAALSETMPTAFAPFDFALEDFELRWEGEPLAGARASWVPGSLQWVRVNDILVVPRARLEVSAPGAARLEARHAGYLQPSSQGSASLQVPVALLSGAEGGVELRMTAADGRERVGKLAIRFKRREGRRIETDASCSRFGVSIAFEGSAHSGWLYAGCRLVEVAGASGTEGSLELQLLWDGSPGGTPPLKLLRAGPRSGEVAFEEKGERARISYGLPSRVSHAFLGLGVGPYHTHFEGAGESTSGWAAMPTLYAAYAFTETTRVVAFDATTFNRHLATDLGFYLSTEQVRTIDRRVSINLMLGIHFTGFRSRGQYYLLPGAPQGLEIIGYDVFRRGHNLVLGGFVYPEINGKEYYNVWLRWGSSGVFGEFNYISWKETIGDLPFLSRSVGLSVGFPVARFL